jgi:hypothetical protein
MNRARSAIVALLLVLSLAAEARSVPATQPAQTPTLAEAITGWKNSHAAYLKAKTEHDAARAEIERLKKELAIAAAKPAEAPAPPKPAEAPKDLVPSTHAVMVGNAEISVVSAKIGKVPLLHMGEDSSSKDDLLIVTVSIKNLSDLKKLEYETWGAQMFSRSPATLEDDVGNSYKRINFGFGSNVVGHVERSESIYPGKSVTDVLVFELPVAGVKDLRISLPTKNVGGKDSDKPIQISIPSPLAGAKQAKQP